MTRLLTICFAMSLLTMTSNASTLTGIVRDGVTSAPLAGAVVRIVQTGDSTLTTGSGTYLFPSVPDGVYTLLVGKASYQPALLVNVAVGNCCIGVRGNVDCSAGDIIDIADLTLLVDHLFLTNPPLCCAEEGNVDASPGGQIDIADLTSLVSYLFITGELPAACQ